MSIKTCATSMVTVLERDSFQTHGDGTTPTTCWKCGLPYLKGEEVVSTNWFDGEGFVSDSSDSHLRCASPEVVATITTDETMFHGRPWTEEDQKRSEEEQEQYWKDHEDDDYDREYSKEYARDIAILRKSCAGCFLAHCGGCPSEPASW